MRIDHRAVDLPLRATAMLDEGASIPAIEVLQERKKLVESLESWRRRRIRDFWFILSKERVKFGIFNQ
jgi:hypothetical protein